MNAHSSIQRPQVRRDAYAPAVTTLLPGCAGEELTVRCSMMMVRDRATQALQGRALADEAATATGMIERLGTTYALASLPLDDLKTLHAEMIRLIMVANNLQALLGARAA